MKYRDVGEKRRPFLYIIGIKLSKFVNKPVGSALVMAFTGHYGVQIRSQLSKVLASAYPQMLFSVYIVVFLVSFHLKTGFPRIALRSRVVHQFTCQCCSALYVGQTRRQIHTLAFDWKRTLYVNHVCIVYSLTNTCTNTHAISASDFKILSSGQGRTECVCVGGGGVLGV